MLTCHVISKQSLQIIKTLFQLRFDEMTACSLHAVVRCDVPEDQYLAVVGSTILISQDKLVCHLLNSCYVSVELNIEV